MAPQDQTCELTDAIMAEYGRITAQERIRNHILTSYVQNGLNGKCRQEKKKHIGDKLASQLIPSSCWKQSASAFGFFRDSGKENEKSVIIPAERHKPRCMLLMPSHVPMFSFQRVQLEQKCCRQVLILEQKMKSRVYPISFAVGECRTLSMKLLEKIYIFDFVLFNVYKIFPTPRR